MTRVERAVAAGLVVLLVVAAAFLVVGPARETHEDISAQRSLVAQQLETLREALTVQRRQLDLAQQQLQVSRETEDLARQGLQATRDLESIARQTLDTARRTGTRADELAALTRRLLALAVTIQRLAALTEQHAANLDRKVP